VSIVLVGVAVQVTGGSDAYAHTPHDDIFGVVLSPDFARDNTALTVSRGILFKSTDRGHSFRRIVKGLDNKSDLDALDMSCCDPRIVYTASRGDGVYRSADGGESWSKANQGLASLDIDLLAASPVAPKVVYAAGPNGLFRSSTAGRSWDQIRAIPDEVTAVGYSPADPGTILVGDSRSTLHISHDDGTTWTAQHLGAVGDIKAIAVSPAGDQVFVGTSGGGVLRADARLQFERVDSGLTETAVSSIVLSPDYGNDATLWAALSNHGVFVSHDRGGTWTRAADGLTTNEQADEPGYEDRPQFGQLRIGKTAGPSSGRTLFLAGFDGLFKSEDSGGHWHEVETLSSNIVVGLAIAPDYASTGTVAVTTYIDGAFLSDDQGMTWKSINNGLAEDVPFRSGADRFARLFGIAFSPDYAADQTLLAARWTDALISASSGAQWQEVGMPHAGSGPPPRQQFVIALSPDYGHDRTVVLGTHSGDVFRSNDGGATYVKAGSAHDPIRSIVMSPAFASDGTLFAGTPQGLYESTDRGTTWKHLSGTFKNTTSLAVSPSLASDGTMFASTRSGLYVSSDRGRTWARVEHVPFPPDDYVEAVAVSPNFAADGIVLASVRGLGLFRSEDHGATFTGVAPGLIDSNQVLSNFANPTAVPLVFSPGFAQDRTIFGYSGTAVLRSTDAGDTWERIDPPKTLHEVPLPRKQSASSRSSWAWVAVILLAVLGLLVLLGIKRLVRKPRAP
jgi:photosystem II stability/assembly factor-like uncharacterized protein